MHSSGFCLKIIFLKLQWRFFFNNIKIGSHYYSLSVIRSQETWSRAHWQMVLPQVPFQLPVSSLQLIETQKDDSQQELFITLGGWYIFIQFQRKMKNKQKQHWFAYRKKKCDHTHRAQVPGTSVCGVQKSPVSFFIFQQSGLSSNSLVVRSQTGKICPCCITHLSAQCTGQRVGPQVSPGLSGWISREHAFQEA